MPNCPKCGSPRYRFELRSGGTTSQTKYYRHGIKSSYVLSSGRRHHESTRKSISVGICPDCGYVQEPREKMTLGAWIILAVLVLGLIGYLSEKFGI